MHLLSLFLIVHTHSGVRLPPTCYFSQLAVSTTCYFSLLAAPLLAVPPSLPFPPLAGSLLAVPPLAIPRPCSFFCWPSLLLLLLCWEPIPGSSPHLQELKSCSLSESTVHINLHCHNPYNIPDHSADVAAA